MHSRIITNRCWSFTTTTAVKPNTGPCSRDSMIFFHFGLVIKWINKRNELYGICASKKVGTKILMTGICMLSCRVSTGENGISLACLKRWVWILHHIVKYLTTQCIYMWTHTHTPTYMCMYTCVYIYVYICTHIHIYIYLLFPPKWATEVCCLYICVYMCTHTYTYIYIPCKKNEGSKEKSEAILNLYQVPFDLYWRSLLVRCSLALY